MLLREKHNDQTVEVLELGDLFDPYQTTIIGRYSVGEEMPDPSSFAKTDLEFCSHEALPECWLNPHYRDFELRHPSTQTTAHRHS